MLLTLIWRNDSYMLWSGWPQNDQYQLDDKLHLCRIIHWSVQRGNWILSNVIKFLCACGFKKCHQCYKHMSKQSTYTGNSFPSTKSLVSLLIIKPGAVNFHQLIAISVQYLPCSLRKVFMAVLYIKQNKWL